jgi:LacI family transcriptional regulator
VTTFTVIDFSVIDYSKGAGVTNIQDVARAAGVSTASVSRFLAGQNIRSADAVREAIAALGYHPSQVARSLKSGRHHSIGVIVPDITNPFFAALVKGIESAVRPHGLQVILGNTDEDPQREEALVSDLTLRTDGLIMAPLFELDTVPLALAASGIPVVFVDREITSGPDLDRVLVDNAAGVRQAVDHLVGLGHRRIAMISGPLSSTPGRARHEAFLAAVTGHGISLDECVLVISDFRESGGFRAVQDIWAAPDRPTAVLVANNLMTMGALKALRELGVSIPGEVSVVGFDDLPLAALLDPPLTVVARPDAEQGALAGRLLVDRLAATEPLAAQRMVMPVELLVRSSTAPPARTPAPKGDAPA